MHTRLAVAMLIVLVAVTTVFTTGCEKDGSAERAGKHIDRAIDDLTDAAKRARR